MRGQVYLFVLPHFGPGTLSSVLVSSFVHWGLSSTVGTPWLMESAVKPFHVVQWLLGPWQDTKKILTCSLASSYSPILKKKKKGSKRNPPATDDQFTLDSTENVPCIIIQSSVPFLSAIYFTFMYSFCNIPPFFKCRFEFLSYVIFLLSEEFLWAFLTRQVFWWQILSIFDYPRKSLLLHHFSRISHWIHNSRLFLSTLYIFHSLTCIVSEEESAISLIFATL